MSTEDRMLAILNRLSDAANTADGSAARMRSVVLHPDECKLLIDYIAAGSTMPKRSPLDQYVPRPMPEQYIPLRDDTLVLLEIVRNLSMALCDAKKS